MKTLHRSSIAQTYLSWEPSDLCASDYIIMPPSHRRLLGELIS